MLVQKRQIAKEEDTTSRMRLSALNMYSTPPMEQLSVTEFEEFAFDRLRRAPRIHARPVRRSRPAPTRVHVPLCPLQS